MNREKFREMYDLFFVLFVVFCVLFVFVKGVVMI